MIDPTVEGFNASRIDVYVHVKGGKRQQNMNVYLDLRVLQAQLQTQEAKRCQMVNRRNGINFKRHGASPCRTFHVINMNAKMRDFDLTRLTTGPEAAMNHVVFISTCFASSFMSGQEMYSTNIPMWGPGHEAPSGLVQLQYADYINRPGMGLYGMKKNHRYANETDIAVQLVEADLLQRHRFLTAWNSKYKDLLGEIW